MKKFEYLVERLYFRKDVDKWLDRSGINNFLNNRGDEGWKLVKVDDDIYYFKREKPGLSEEEQKALEEKERFEKLQAKVQFDKNLKECDQIYEKLIQKYPQLRENSVFNNYYERFKNGEVSPEQFKEKAEAFVQVL